MSRQLAIVIAHLLRGAGDPNDTHAHLIAIDQETGKGVMLDLDLGGGYTWKPLPRVPVHLLGPIDCPRCGGGDAHADTCPEPRQPGETEAEAEERRNSIRRAIVRGGIFDPDIRRDLMEGGVFNPGTKRCKVRLMPSGGYTTDASSSTIAQCVLTAGHEPSPHQFPRVGVPNKERTLRSDIEEDR